MIKKNKKKRTAHKKQDIIFFTKDVISRVQKEHGLSDYRVKVRCDSELRGHTMADIRIDNDYLRATVTLYPIFIEKYNDGDYEELKEALCHEIFHIKTSAIEEMAVNRWGTPDTLHSEIERLTEIYGRLVYKCMTIEGKFKNIKATHDIPKPKTKRKKSR